MRGTFLVHKYVHVYFMRTFLKTAALLIAHDHHWYLDATIRALRGLVPAYVFVNRLPFFGDAKKLGKIGM